MSRSSFMLRVLCTLMAVGVLLSRMSEGETSRKPAPGQGAAEQSETSFRVPDRLNYQGQPRSKGWLRRKYRQYKDKIIVTPEAKYLSLFPGVRGQKFDSTPNSYFTKEGPCWTKPAPDFFRAVSQGKRKLATHEPVYITRQPVWQRLAPFKPGQWGLTMKSLWQILEGKDRMLVDCSPVESRVRITPAPPPETAESFPEVATIYVQGILTEGFSDGEELPKDLQLRPLICVGTCRYQTAIGGSNTVPHCIPFPEKPLTLEQFVDALRQGHEPQNH